LHKLNAISCSALLAAIREPKRIRLAFDAIDRF
jgi:hypothetical protein